MYKIKAAIAAALAVIICCMTIVDNTDRYKNAAATEIEEQISEYEQKLQEIEQKENELNNQLANTADSIENEQERQKILDEQIQNTYDKIAAMQAYISDLEVEIADLDTQIRNVEDSIEKRQVEIDKGIEDFGKRLRAMYISGEEGYAGVILDSRDFYDTLMRVELVKRVAGYDNEIIENLIDLKKQQEAEKEALEIKQSEITDTMHEYSSELSDLQEEKDNLQTLYEESTKSLEELEQWQNEYLAQQQQLNADKNDVSDTLSDLEQQKLEEERQAEFERQQQLLLEQMEQERLEQEQNNSNSDLANEGVNDVDDDSQTGGSQENNDEDNSSGNVNTSAGETYSGSLDPVLDMARSMVGGSYVWGAATPTASDCSGLTMQCYAKIGISLPHKASMQASYGRSVNYSEMKPGDLIFYGGTSYSSIYHVAIYVGNGMIIHAESTRTGIVISNSDTVAKYNHITVIKRLVE